MTATCPVCLLPVRVTASIFRPLYDIHTNSLGRLCIGSGEPCTSDQTSA